MQAWTHLINSQIYWMHLEQIQEQSNHLSNT